MTIWILDISNHQGDFDVSGAVREGYSAVWAKATEGTSFRDKWFDSNVAKTVSAGAVPGAYHYLRAGSGRSQCDAFFSRIRDHGGPVGWLVACDNEADASWETTQAFFTRWRELAGDHPLFMYSGNWWWSAGRGWPGSSLTPYLWDSRYVSGSGFGSALYTKVPDSWWTPRYGGWTSTTVLQFSSSALVCGKSVDVSAFRGSVDDLRALVRGGSGSVTPGNDGGSSAGDGSSGMSASFSDEFRNLLIGTPPPDWMGGPRTAMRLGDWYGSIPGKLTEIHVAANGAISEAVRATTVASEARAAATETLTLVRQLVERLSAMSVGAVDVPALAQALSALLPTAPSAETIAGAVVDDLANRLDDAPETDGSS